MDSSTIAECPHRETLLSYVRRKVPHERYLQIESHVNHCAKCQEIVRDLAKIRDPDATEGNLYYDPEATEVESKMYEVVAPTCVEHSTTGRPVGPLADIVSGQTLGDFVLVQELGAGSFAKVFLARQESLQWLVALKVTKHQSDEAPTLARLDHENIIRIHGLYILQEDELLLVSMKYVPGGTLDSVIRDVHAAEEHPTSGDAVLRSIDSILVSRGETVPLSSAYRKELGRLDWDLAVCWVGAKLADALDHAHDRDVLHRDIKPANILLSAEATPMLADFNISFNAAVDEATADTNFGGSLLYMSPEQLEACNPASGLRPSDLDGRSDIYSLGLVLWEMLTGDRPFSTGASVGPSYMRPSELAKSRREGLPPSAIQRLPKSVSPGVRQILQRCLEPEVSQRWPNPQRLSGALKKQLRRGMTKLLYPPAESWRNWFIRYPMGLIFLAAFIPNAVLTPIDVLMNVRGIVGSLPEAEQAMFWKKLIPIVNGIAWPIPTFILIAYALPVLAGCRTIREGRDIDDADWLQVNRRTLRLGLCIGVIVFFSWLVTGVAFPFGIDLANTESGLDRSVYVQFILSQALHGLIAGTVSYLFVTFVCVHAIYPRLVPTDPPENEASEDLHLLAHVNSVNFVLLGSVPLLAITALATVFWDTGTSLRFVFVFLAFLGAIGFMLAGRLNKTMAVDLDLLEAAVQPNEEYFLHSKHGERR